MTIGQLEKLFMFIFYVTVAIIFIAILVDAIRSNFFGLGKWNRASKRLKTKEAAPAKGEDIVPEGLVARKFPASSGEDAPREAFEKMGTNRPLHISGGTISGNLLKTQKEQDKKRIGGILVARGLITQDILDQALEHQKRYGGSLTQYLLHYGCIDEKQLAQCLCSQFRVPYLPIESYVISDEIIHLIPTDIVEKYWVLPVEKNGDALTVVMVDPLDTKVIKELEELTGLTIVPFVGIISEIVSSLQTYYKIFIKDQGVKVPPFFIDTKIYAGQERRRSIRYDVAIDIQFPAQGQYLKSQTINVSRDGFVLTSSRPVPLGSLLTMELNLPQEISAFPIAVVTQVVRCLPRENENFEIGVRTMKISKDEIGMIINYAVQKEEEKKNEQKDNR